ncbi:recombinase family protein [Bacteroides acidifaciens]|uniref:recombinase family protein n=1 Tax=Bacteroides acidifaciens TaxID=85831 RepID=UPI00301457D8
MAKVGYIFKANYYDTIDADREWMQQFNCVRVIEESVEHEKLRPQWKQLMASLERGDEVVVSKFSNAVRGLRELATFIELCRIKVVRIISIHDKIDSRGLLFPDTTVTEVLEMFGALPEETAALRQSSAHVMHLQQNIKVPAKGIKSMSKTERENSIVDMYNNGYSIDDIWTMSGFKSRSSVFRILNKRNVELNRGRTSGVRGKRKPEEE